MGADVIVDVAVAKLHPYEDDGLIPPLSGEEFEGLVGDIKARGVQNPLAILEDGTVVDGKHRLRAAITLGLATVPCRWIDAEILPPSSPKLDDLIREYMVRDVVHRRHLTTEAKTELLRKIVVPCDSPSGEARKGAKSPKRTNSEASRSAETQASPKEGKSAQGGASARPPLPPQPTVKLASGRVLSVKKAAEEFGVSRKTVQDVVKVKRAEQENPELAGLPVRKVLREAKEKGATPDDRERQAVKDRMKALADLCSTCDLFPCQKLKDFLDEVERAACGRPTHERGSARTPVQEIVNRYKVLKGAPADDVSWDKKFFAAFIRPAKELLDKCDEDGAKAIRILEAAARMFAKNRLSWTLHTVVKPHILSELYGKEASNGAGGNKYKFDVTPDDE